HHHYLHSFPTRRSSDLDFLIKALRFGLKHIEIVDDLSPIVFWNAGKKMVVMPLRPDGPASRPAPQPAPTASAPAHKQEQKQGHLDRKSTRLNSSHVEIS